MLTRRSLGLGALMLAGGMCLAGLAAEEPKSAPFELRFRNYRIQPKKKAEPAFLELYFDLLTPKATKALYLKRGKVTSVLDAKGNELVTKRSYLGLGDAPEDTSAKSTDRPNDPATDKVHSHVVHIKRLAVPEDLKTLQSVAGEVNLVEAVQLKVDDIEDLRAAMKQNKNVIQLNKNCKIKLSVSANKTRTETRDTGIGKNVLNPRTPEFLRVHFRDADGKALRGCVSGEGGGGPRFRFDESKYGEPLPEKIKCIVSYPTETKSHKVPVSFKGIKLVEAKPRESKKPKQ